MSYNKSLHRTFDPLRFFAVTKNAHASNACELRRQASLVKLMTFTINSKIYSGTLLFIAAMNLVGSITLYATVIYRGQLANVSLFQSLLALAGLCLVASIIYCVLKKRGPIKILIWVWSVMLFITGLSSLLLSQLQASASVQYPISFYMFNLLFVTLGAYFFFGVNYHIKMNSAEKDA